MQDLCKHGGWQLGHLMDGTHAEYFRMPYADTGLYHVPHGVDERGLLVVSDTLPTGLEVGAIRGNVHPGCTVAIVGAGRAISPETWTVQITNTNDPAGPVGLAAGLTSTLYSPRSITFFDLSDSRLELAKRMLPGASTHTINTSGVKGSDAIRDLAKGLFDAQIDGFDVVMEAVGIPATFDVCQNLVGKGGTIANIGVHSTKVDLAIDRLWPRGTSELLSLIRQIFVGTWERITDKGDPLDSTLYGSGQHTYHPEDPGLAIRRQAGDSSFDDLSWYVFPIHYTRAS